MNTTDLSAPADLAVEEARDVLDCWSVAAFYRVRGLGTRIDIDAISTHGSVSILVSSQFEHRTVERTALPYKGGPIDDRGRPPGLWQMDVDAPAVFANRTERYVVPHTDDICTCRECGGDGTVTCSPCHGWGKVDCTWCHGRGYRERQEHRSGGPGSHGSWTTVRDSCTCFMGKVNCTWCNGHGTRTCGTCDGHGRMKEYDELVVQFEVDERSDVLDAADMPADLVQQASGRMLADQEEDLITRPARLTPDIDDAVDGVLGQTQSYDRAVSRLHFQRLTVEQVPVYEVSYRYGAKADRLWIYGDERKVHWPNPPQPWVKYLLTVLGVLALAAGVVGLASMLLD